MSWKKHFRTYRPTQLDQSFDQGSYTDNRGTSVSKTSSILPEIYAGHPNRIQRYYQYEDMGRDSDIAAALDTIADFCTQSEEQNDAPFQIVHRQEPVESEVKLINEALNQWLKVTELRKRLWKIFRDAIQYGDAFFVRDPETGKHYWVDHFAVELVKMSTDGSKKPEEYVLKNFDPNVTERFGTPCSDLSKYRNPSGTGSSMARPGAAPVSGGGASNFQMAGIENDARRRMLNGGAQSGIAAHSVIDAEHMIHLSMSEGMDPNWPFGKSILEPVFKTYKQKELLEDSIIIYRVQRAPERRIFYIDVGQANSIKAKAQLEAIKNEIHQRRIPNRTGGGSSIMDAAYNPLSMLDDYYFAQTSDGRGSKVEVLPSGDALGEITDLSFFTKKLARGLRIPTSYLSLSDDEAPAAYNDGKLGQALIQEFRFNKYCMRLQSLLIGKFDEDFKKYLEDSGIQNLADFELEFNPPQNFTKYRQIELDTQQAQVYSQLQGVKVLSERWKLKRYLNMTDDEILENEVLWAEENSGKFADTTGATPAETDSQGDLGSIGISPPDEFGMGDMGDEAGEGDIPMDDASMDTGAPDGGMDTAPAAAPPPPGGGAPK